MARISTYQQDTNVTGQDKVIGSDTTGSTRNYTIDSIGEYMSQQNSISMSGQVSYKFISDSNDKNHGMFMKTINGGGNGSELSSMTGVVINKYLSNGVFIDEFLKKIFDNRVRIIKLSDQNVFYEYTVSSVTQNSELEDYYDIVLIPESGQGSLEDEAYYGFASMDNSDKNYVFTQSSASNEWNINHNLNKRPSVTIVDSAGDMVMGDVEYVNNNTVTVRFSGAFAGKAYLN